MLKQDKKPSFLENVNMMVNDTLNHIDIDPNIAKILKTCRSVLQVKFPIKLKGEIKKCNEYLGRNFMLTGEVVHGDGLGKKINFPTANIEIPETYKIIPKNGVYLVKAIINSEIYFGMMNIGVRPTIGGENKSLEIHFFNFKDNIYNKTFSVEIICKIRDEEKFSSIDKLKIQLKKDEQFCLKLINK